MLKHAECSLSQSQSSCSVRPDIESVISVANIIVLILGNNLYVDVRKNHPFLALLSIIICVNLCSMDEIEFSQNSDSYLPSE